MFLLGKVFHHNSNNYETRYVRFLTVVTNPPNLFNSSLLNLYLVQCMYIYIYIYIYIYYMYSRMNVFSRKSKCMMNGTLQCYHLTVVILNLSVGNLVLN